MYINHSSHFFYSNEKQLSTRVESAPLLDFDKIPDLSDSCKVLKKGEWLAGDTQALLRQQQEAEIETQALSLGQQITAYEQKGAPLKFEDYRSFLDTLEEFAGTCQKIESSRGSLESKQSHLKSSKQTILLIKDKGEDFLEALLEKAQIDLGEAKALLQNPIHRREGEKLLWELKREFLGLNRVRSLLNHLSEKTPAPRCESVGQIFSYLLSPKKILGLDPKEHYRQEKQGWRSATHSLIENHLSLIESLESLNEEVKKLTPGKRPSGRKKLPSPQTHGAKARLKRQERALAKSKETEDNWQGKWLCRAALALQLFSGGSWVQNIWQQNSQNFTPSPSCCGNKHRRLMEMAHDVQEMNHPGVHVPMPFGISSSHTVDFLKKTTPQLWTEWQQLADGFDESKNPLQFLEANEKKIEALQQEIIKAFSQAAQEEKTGKLFAGYQQLHEWLAQAKEKGLLLMVRSSGDEDGAVANAGGNLSLSYVSPTLEATLSGIGQVVASYFSVSSLRNRINSDTNPFATAFKLGVTLQELIGETVGGDPHSPPVSIVLFSNEPDYTGSSLGKDFRILRLSAAFGHGEGIVGNQGIGSDKIFILQSRLNPDELYILYDNCPKLTRLVPMRESNGQVTLKVVDNPKELINQRAVNQSTLKQLFVLAVELEKKYGEPIDMELVVKEGKIYPVQQRPVNRKVALPSYINFDAVPAKEQIRAFDLQVIVPGTSSALIIEKPEEILVAGKLGDAEKLFNNKHDKVVIVGQDEPPNSHPVVNFSGQGVPCLHTPQFAKVAQFTDGEQMLLCLQQGKAMIASKEIAVSDLIKEGYTSHPAPISHGYPLQSIRANNPTKELKLLLSAIKTSKSTKQKLEALSRLFAHASLNSLRESKQQLMAASQQMKMIPPIVQETLNAISRFEKQFEQARVELALSLEDSQATKLDPLFHLKVIETMLIQKEGLTLPGLLGALEASQVAINHQKNVATPAQLIEEALLLDHGVTAEVKQEWLSFLKELETSQISPEIIVRFKKMIAPLKENQILSEWMLLHFAPAWRESKNGSSSPLMKLLSVLWKENSDDPVVMKLLAAFDEKTEQALHLCSKQQKALTQLDLSIFENPGSLESGMIILKELVDVYASPEWIDMYKESSDIAKAAALKTMEQCVDVYDKAIKRMKASPHFTSIAKIEPLRAMLTPYFDLLYSWMRAFLLSRWIPKFLFDHNMIEGELADILPSPVPVHRNWPMKVYLEKVRSLLASLGKEEVLDCMDEDLPPPPLEAQLQPSANFTVSSALYGTATEFHRHLPCTLEDIFTLIHQNLLVTMGVLQKELYGSLAAQLPSPLVTAMKEVMQVNRGTLQWTSLKIESDKATVHYNIPMRSHSGSLTFTYHEDSPLLTMTLNLLGPARTRWQSSADHFSILADLGHLFSLKETPQVGSQLLTVSLELLPEHLQNTLKHVDRLIAYSFAWWDFTILNDAIEKEIKKLSKGQLIQAALKGNSHVVNRVIQLALDWGDAREDLPLLRKLASLAMAHPNPMVQSQGHRLSKKLIE